MLAILKLIPFKDWMYLAIITAILGVGYKLYAHGEDVQKQKDAAVDAKLTAAQLVHNEEVETRAKKLTDDAMAAYKDTLAAPPAADAPHSVCHNVLVPPRGRSTDVRDRQDSNAKADIPTAGSTDTTTADFDPGPALDKLHEDCDGQVIALQAYITACVKVGICKEPQ